MELMESHVMAWSYNLLLKHFHDAHYMAVMFADAHVEEHYQHVAYISYLQSCESIPFLDIPF